MLNRVKLLRARLNGSVAGAQIAEALTTITFLLDSALAAELASDKEGREELERGIIEHLKAAIESLDKALHALGVK